VIASKKFCRRLWKKVRRWLWNLPWLWGWRF